MKFIKFFLSSLFLLFTLAGFSQDIVLASQADVDAFDPNTSIVNGNLTLKPNSISNIDNLSNLHAIIGNFHILGNSGLTYVTALPNLDALSNLTTIGQDLLISNVEFYDIDGLSNIVSIGNNLEISWMRNLINLDFTNLESIGGDFKVVQNTAGLSTVTGFQDLTFLGGDFEISGNAIGNVTGFHNLLSIGGSLILSGVTNPGTPGVYLNGLYNLVNIGGDLSLTYGSFNGYNTLSNLTTIAGHLDIYVGGSSISNPHSHLSNLTSIGGNLNLFQSNDGLIENLTNLTSIGGGLIIYGSNNFVTNLDGLSNLSSVGGDLQIYSNSNLSDCCGIQNLLLLPDGITGSITIENNATECDNLAAVMSNCSFTKVQGQTYWDMNENGIYDIGDAPFNGVVNVEPSGISVYVSDGQYNIYTLDVGDYIIDYTPFPNWVLSSDSASYHVTVDNSILSGYDFGVVPTETLVTMVGNVSSGLTICDGWVPFHFTWQNTGTTILNGTVDVDLDDWINGINFGIETPDNIINSQHFQWDFDNLFPTKTISKTIYLKMPGIVNGFNLGDSITIDMDVSFSPINTINYPISNIQLDYDPIILCSYDPNDKLVSPNRPGDDNPTLFGEPLVYTIRFQNTGNYYATDVVVRDTLDDNLDPSTFRVLNSSHNNLLNTTMENNKHLTFSFESIMLPDSTLSFDDSQGFVSYIIEPYDGLQIGTVIENTAHIYFDSNPAIVTNTIQNTLTNEINSNIILNVCDSIIHNDEVYFESTILSADTIGLYDGFIIEHVEIEMNYSTTNEENIDHPEGTSYILPNGVFVSQTGTYFSTLINSVGCDSIVQTNLTILSGIINVNDKTLNFNVYPNPTTDDFQIDIKGNTELLDLVIYNSLAQKIVETEIQESILINTDKWSKGIYSIVIYDKNGKIIGIEKVVFN